MKQNRLNISTNLISTFMLALVLWTGCKEPFYPPPGRESVGYLVINGYLNASLQDSTFITLSRTRSLTDSVTFYPEKNAQVAVLGTSGTQYMLSETDSGTYVSSGLPLNLNEQYRLQILTADGKKYLSDTISVRPSPPIDSISWRFDSTSSDNKKGVTIFTNTHDPQGNTRYYQWDYDETWEYHAAFFSYYIYENGQMIEKTPDQYTFACFHYFKSTDLKLASSASLSQDLIFENPLVFIPKADEKLGVKYSIFVRQHVLTKDAYEYWQNLKKNTELTGSIFDPQPSQVTGNIHCTSNPDEPVIGYISASTVQTQRIFISYRQLDGWNYVIPGGCESFQIDGTQWDSYFRLRGYVPLYPYFGGMWGALSTCADCTARGGSLPVPSYW